jgi:hypothetical protein
MEEFNFDINDEIGTTVSQLKSKSNLNESNINTHSEDFDYDKVIDILNSEPNNPTINSELNNSTFNYDVNRDSIINSMSGKRVDIKSNENMFKYNIENKPKKQQNMNRFVKELENNLDNFEKINLNEPLPVNFTKQMIPITNTNTNTNKNIIMRPIINIDNKKEITKDTTKVSVKEETKEAKKANEEIKEQTIINVINDFLNKINFREIFICMLLFMILNNKIIIEFIYMYVPYIKIIESPYPNLILRTIFFGFFLLIIKKFNL